jgi:hypothetical protein
MKKFSFFSVLLVALFMLCGFAGNAQTYKSPTDAVIALKSIAGNANNTIAQDNSEQITPSNANLATMLLRVNLSEELMGAIKQSQNVAKSIDDLYNFYFISSDPRTYATKAEIDFIKSQLLN